MGGLREEDPADLLDLRWSAPLAIAGVPFLSGFFSKEEILAGALNGTAIGPWLFAVGLVTARSHRLLHDAPVRAHLPRPLPRRPREPSTTCTSRPEHAGAAVPAGGRLDRGGLPLAARRARSSCSRSSGCPRRIRSAIAPGCRGWPARDRGPRHRRACVPVHALRRRAAAHRGVASGGLRGVLEASTASTTPFDWFARPRGGAAAARRALEARRRAVHRRRRERHGHRGRPRARPRACACCSPAWCAATRC